MITCSRGRGGGDREVGYIVFKNRRQEVGEARGPKRKVRR